jgi:hypothetical protein
MQRVTLPPIEVLQQPINFGNVIKLTMNHC